MTQTRQTTLPMLLMTVLAACSICWTVPAGAQPRQSPPEVQKPERRDRPRRAGPPAQDEHRPGPHRGRLPGRHLFRPLPEDEGPLEPDEERALLSFVRQHVPYIHRELRKLRRRDPAAFRARLDETAPHLRQLRRIFERNPELGERFVRHSENTHRIERARRAWIDSVDDPEMRRRISLALRRMVAENVRIEAAVLTNRADEMTEQYDRWVAADYERLRDAASNLAGEPGEVRELVRALWAAADQEQREELTAHLRRICADRLDREIAHLRERAAQMQKNAAREVDRRIMRLTRMPMRGPENRSDWRQDRDRRQNDGDANRRGRSPDKRP